MQERSFSPVSLSLKVFLFSLSMMAVPSQAFAGFQWVSPQEEGALSPAPSAMVQSAPSPVIVEAPEVVIDPKAQMLKKQELQASESPALPSTMTISPTSSVSPVAMPAQARKEESKPVRGFANNVPLAVALRQILPPEYGFSVDQDVNMGMLVSWRGGKAWQETLQDMLQESALSMREQGQMVSISRVREAEQKEPVMPVMAPASPQAPLALTPSPFEKNPSHLLAPPTVEERIAPSFSSLSVAPPINIAAEPSIAATSLETPEVWTAERGQTLRAVIERWAAKVGIEVSWQAEYDYPIQVPFSVTGTFEEGVRTILKGFESAKPQPSAALHNNALAGQSVLVVTARGNNYGE